MAKLILSSIRFQPVVRRTIETLGKAEPQAYAPVEIGLRNIDCAKMLYFISRPRTVRYDAEAHHLSLRFEEPDPAQLTRPELRIPPRIDSLGPGQETTLVVHVPLRLRIIHTTERVDQAIVESDLSEVAAVTCRIAYAGEPFSRRPGETAAEMVRRLHAWGERTELSVEDSIPAAKDDYRPKPIQGADDADAE